MKIRVGVFFGGPSVEHEVSIITGLQAVAAMDSEKYQVIPVYAGKDSRLYVGEGLSDIETFRGLPGVIAGFQRVELMELEAGACLTAVPQKRFGKSYCQPLDVALLAFHGTGGEDGVMQGMFERVHLPYTGCDVTASAIGMDKWAMKACFKAAGVPCLDGVKTLRQSFFEDREGQLDIIEKSLPYPIIVKPYNLGSSVGIGLARDRLELSRCMEEALAYSKATLCERAVQNLREINCSVLGDDDEAAASVCEEPLGAEGFLSYADKYQGGGKGAKGAAGSKDSGMASLSRRVPADLPEEVSARIQRLAIDAFHAVGAAGVARIDFLLDGKTGEIFANEINTIPGSLSFYLWEKSGVSFTELLDRLVSLALKRQREMSRLQRSFDVNLLAGVSLGGVKGAKGGKL